MQTFGRTAPPVRCVRGPRATGRRLQQRPLAHGWFVYTPAYLNFFSICSATNSWPASLKWLPS